jgi:PhnB protein
MGGFSISLDVATPAEAERVFAGLSKGGTVGMPLAETFFAKSFGMLTDRFGTPWMIICPKPM